MRRKARIAAGGRSWRQTSIVLPGTIPAVTVGVAECSEAEMKVNIHAAQKEV